MQYRQAAEFVNTTLHYQGLAASSSWTVQVLQTPTIAATVVH
jgi:hypothetical protein